MADKLTDPDAAPKGANTIAPNDFLSMLGDMLAATVKKDRGVASVRHVRSRMEKIGCDMRALDLMLSLRKLEPEEAESRLRNALRYARWAGLSVGEQSDMLHASEDAVAPSTDAKSQWSAAEIHDQGYKAGLAGRNSTDHSFMPGTPNHQAFYEGWQDGQRTLGEKLFGKAELPKDGTVIRPGKVAKPATVTPKRGGPGRRQRGQTEH